MSTFDTDPFRKNQPPIPKSFENESHVILKQPAIEIDLAQPNRVSQELVDEVVGIEGSKLIATIVTPTRQVGICYAQEPGFDPMVIVIDGEDKEESKKRLTIGLGEDLDLSDIGEEGKCIVTVDIHGRVFVNAVQVDTNYQIFTRELTQDAYFPPPEETLDEYPSDYQDDPES